MPATYQDQHDVAVEAARQAAAVIRAHAGRLDDDAIRKKGHNDLVTFVDEEAQDIITRTVREAFPSYAVMAEEGPSQAWPGAREGDYCWIIDPIDGTTNFAHGVPPFGVSIALRRGSDVVVGVVLEVARDELFTAVRGGGLHVNGTRRRVSTTASLAESLITTGFPYQAFEHLDVYLDVLGRFIRESRGIRRPGAASVDLAYVAAGRFDGFFESGLDPWDVAAGALLVEEAGGRVTDFHGRPEVVFGHQAVATNGAIHDAVLEVLQPMREVRA